MKVHCLLPAGQPQLRSQLSDRTPTVTGASCAGAIQARRLGVRQTSAYAT